MATHNQGRMLDTLDHELSRHANNGRLCVTVTGSGGKTTTIGHLARRWAAKGFSVLITTSTRMTHPNFHQYDVDQIMLFDGAYEKPLSIRIRVAWCSLEWMQGRR